MDWTGLGCAGDLLPALLVPVRGSCLVVGLTTLVDDDGSFTTTIGTLHDDDLVCTAIAGEGGVGVVVGLGRHDVLSIRCSDSGVVV
jgi:hypothetical protein